MATDIPSDPISNTDLAQQISALDVRTAERFVMIEGRLIPLESIATSLQELVRLIGALRMAMHVLWGRIKKAVGVFLLAVMTGGGLLLGNRLFIHFFG